MTSITALLDAISEQRIEQRVGIPHDEARASYALRSVTVDSFAEFSQIIGDYYTYHFTRCVVRGGTMARAEAAGRAKQIVEQAYRKRNGTIVSAFHDAEGGLNGGMRAILDLIAEALKTESVELYVRNAFDTFVAPNAWDEKVEIVRQFIAACGPLLAGTIEANRPERYAHDYDVLIRSFVTAFQRTSSVFRRI